MRVALFEPDIPQNTGNIFRLSACWGVEIDIIGPTGFIFDDKRFKRSSMDYFEHVKYRKHLDWKSFKNWSSENNYRLILLTTRADTKFYNFEFQKKDILLFGRESAGVPDYIHRELKLKLLIPMRKGIRSINLSSSVAIVLGEALRQIKLF